MYEPIEKNGKTFLPVFVAGVYPQATIDELFLMQVVLNYNKSFHAAPIWIGHPGYEETGKNEPQALAWVASLMLVGKVLYAELEDESPEFKALIAGKKFKVWSAELVEFIVNGENLPYLFAIGLTNRPAVHGLKPFTVAEYTKFTGHNFKTTEIQKKFLFEQTEFTNQTKQEMKEHILKLLRKFKIEFTDADDESTLLNKLESFVSAKFTDFESKIATFTNASTGAADSVAQLQTELQKIKDERVGDFVEAAILAGKVLPSQKEALTIMGKADFAALKNFIGEMGKHPMFTKQINSGNGDTPAALKFDSTDARFKHPKENRPVTFTDLVNDVDLSGKFTTDEIEALRIAEIAQK